MDNNPQSPRPRTIVLVIGMNTRRVGGVEVHTRELVSRLALQGWQAVLCFHQPPAPEVRKYLSLPNVTWEEMPDAWRNSLRASRDLLRIVRRHQPRLLHLQFTPFLSPLPWIARLNGVKGIVITDHTSRPEGYIAARQPAWKRALARLVNLPVSLSVEVSEYTRGIIATLGTFPEARMRRVYNGVDLGGRDRADHAAGAAFRARHGIPPERILVTQVSQINPEKGIPDVLEAARMALAQFANLHFAFVGDGQYLEEYKLRSADTGIQDHVTWTGLVTDPMAEGVFAATDISSQASRWEEAFGLSIAEAMSFEKPVVATRVGGIPEVVEDGKTGFLVPRRDAAALAEKFVLLARDQQLRRRMGLAGRARAESLFDVRTNVGILLDLYGEF
jgi:glycosyltransferase involved in cell wall biosynthesis